MHDEVLYGLSNRSRSEQRSTCPIKERKRLPRCKIAPVISCCEPPAASCQPTPCPSPSLPHRGLTLLTPAPGRNAAPTKVQSQPYLGLTPSGACDTPVGPSGTHSSQAPSREVSAGPATLGVQGPGSPYPLCSRPWCSSNTPINDCLGL